MGAKREGAGGVERTGGGWRRRRGGKGGRAAEGRKSAGAGGTGPPFPRKKRVEKENARLVRALGTVWHAHCRLTSRTV